MTWFLVINLKTEFWFHELNRINLIFTYFLFIWKAKKSYKIVMLRHGESEWNKMNKFCGWFDSDLTEKGKIDLYIVS